ncbi:hypothetical protein [Citrobacter amalonaticus]|uniref:hypothetical protein n=1 Tax=Citrobacter amalonaticus TaxID=35703 RepID=UPI00300C7AD1
MIAVLGWFLFIVVCFGFGQGGDHTALDSKPERSDQLLESSPRTQAKGRTQAKPPHPWQVWLSENQSDVFVLSVAFIAVVIGLVSCYP